MKLNKLAYNPEIGHCSGKRQKVCVRCLRKALMDTWLALPVEEREAIILFAPRAGSVTCPSLISMTEGYEAKRSAPVNVRYLTAGKGVAI